jgi:hypothetical protein
MNQRTLHILLRSVPSEVGQRSMHLRVDYIQRAGRIKWRTSDSQIVHQSVGGAVVTRRLVATFLLSNEAGRRLSDHFTRTV